MHKRMKALSAFVFCTVMLGIADAFAESGHGAVHDIAKAEHGNGGLPQFDPSSYPSQIFWLAVTFVIMYVFFSTKTLPDISSVLENRRNHIQDDLDTAERMKEEAEAAQKSYETALNDARSEATQMITKMHDKLKNKADSEYKKFREKSEHEIAALENRIDNARATALEDMNTIAAEVASAAASKIVGIDADVKEANKVVKALSKKEAA